MDGLKHTTRHTPWGAKVMVLDNGAVIGPEAQAMLGALHSRNPNGMENHLEAVARRGPEEFLKVFYTGFGHKSIADMAPVFISIEGVSMLAAKAIQDFPLYRGQEVSTRYVDFSTQPFLPNDGKVDTAGLRAMFLKVYETMVEKLAENNPVGEADPKVHEKAIKAKAFDVCRSLLPAGASTNLNWSGDFRQVQDHLAILRGHSLQEVRDIGEAVMSALSERYPSSFPGRRDPSVEEYNRCYARRYETYTRYVDYNVPLVEWPSQLRASHAIDLGDIWQYRDAMLDRPVRAELPWNIRELGVATFDFSLDFGSYRDLQRQRAVTIPMPLLTFGLGFEPWYLDMMPKGLANEVARFLIAYIDDVRRVVPDLLQQQYYAPMGFRVPIRLTGDLRALTYLVELRSSRFVHPTLRRRAKEMAKQLQKWFDYPIHLDEAEDILDLKRGTHDIIEKV
jgi:thymidylate synthase ThyX